MSNKSGGKGLTQEQKKAIDEAAAYADKEDKSTEWMFQFAADKAGCDVDDVIDYFVEGNEVYDAVE